MPHNMSDSYNITDENDNAIRDGRVKYRATSSVIV